MLRLTRTAETPGGIVLKAEGQIVAEWVSVLEEEVRQLNRPDRQVVLDLGEVNYLDRHAVRLIRTLAAGPVSLVNCSPLVEELLAEDLP
jgi:anti-anti-sigma regulatory factor